jgi:hypothetical protein
MNAKEGLNNARERIKIAREKFLTGIEASRNRVEGFLNSKRKVRINGFNF